jgi:hypothetical protein
VGVGDSLDAPFTLLGPISAGTWHLIGDGMVLQPVDIRYDVVWRPAADGGVETTLATVTHHFDPPPPPTQFNAVQLETDVPGTAAAAHAGDLLIWRFSGMGSGSGLAFIPNGDGGHAGGRIPSLRLP